MTHYATVFVFWLSILGGIAASFVLGRLPCERKEARRG